MAGWMKCVEFVKFSQMYRSYLSLLVVLPDGCGVELLYSRGLLYFCNK